MKKIFVLLVAYTFLVSACYASKIPDEAQNLIKKSFPAVDIRFDGVIILPDGTLYLPLYPSKIKNPKDVVVVKTYPENTSFDKKPEVVIFNNDFALLRVTVNSNGEKTIKKFDEVPMVLKSGLLPQDMLIPKNLTIPENMKSIAGNLSIKILPEDEIRVAPAKIEYEKPLNPIQKLTNKIGSIPQLKDKTLFVSTHYTKDIQVVKGESKNAEYALSQKSIPYSIKITPDNKFLLITTFNSTLLNVVSIADDRIIKQLDLTTQGGEIVIDKEKNTAFVLSPSASTIYEVSLDEMILKKKIRVNGMCEKPALCGNFFMYVDKKTNKLWSIEFDNEYALRDLGMYPNASKILYDDGNVYVISRTANRLAIIDYRNLTLVAEFEIAKKPTDMIINGDILYVLSSEDNLLHSINKKTFEMLEPIKLANNGFSNRIVSIPDSNFVIVTDAKAGMYSIVDLNKKTCVKSTNLDIPVTDIIIGKTIRKI